MLCHTRRLHIRDGGTDLTITAVGPHQRDLRLQLESSAWTTFRRHASRSTRHEKGSSGESRAPGCLIVDEAITARLYEWRARPAPGRRSIPQACR